MSVKIFQMVAVEVREHWTQVVAVEARRWRRRRRRRELT